MAGQVVKIKGPSKRKGSGVVSGKPKRQRKGPHGVELKEKKKTKKCATGTVYNAKLNKCVSNRKKGETLLEWQHRNTLESLTKPKKKGIA